MQLCSRHIRLDTLVRSKLTHPRSLLPVLLQSVSLTPRCTLSTNSTSSQPGPTSSPSTLPTTPSPSATSPPNLSRTCTFNNHSSKLPIHSPSSLSHQARAYSSARWKSRQTSDPYNRLARVQDLKSRAAFKLLQINDRHRLFRPGQTVVDLGFAPGSWSQVAIDLVKPTGRVVGVDLIPARPPKGVSAIQGDFMSEDVRLELRRFLMEGVTTGQNGSGEGYIDRLERGSEGGEDEESDNGERDSEERCVDVVLSDMCEPWDLVEGHYKRTLSNPYYRMMNTSGNAFRDHAGSMDLSLTALAFAQSTLTPGGHFVCKFYQGAEDKDLERRLKDVFTKVHREKPESSRSESKEAYFVGVKRLG